VCSQGACVTGLAGNLEPTADAPTALALDPDGTAVYWSRRNGATYEVVRYVKATAARSVVLSGLSDVQALVVDDLYVFATVAGSTTDGSVVRASKTGGGPKTIATNLYNARGVAVDATHLYFCEAGSLSNPDGVVHVTAKDGTGDTKPYTGVQDPEDVAVAGANLVYSQYAANQVVIAPVAGGTPVKVFTGENNALPVAAAGTTDFYWANFTFTKVRHFALGAAGPDTLQPQPPQYTSAAGIAVDATWVYYTALGDTSHAEVLAVKRDQSSTATLATNQAGPTAIAADAACVYWVDEGIVNYPTLTTIQAKTGGIMRIDKPQ
jgi:hypothetical protein